MGGSIGGSRSHLGRLVQPSLENLAGGGSWVNLPSFLLLCSGLITCMRSMSFFSFPLISGVVDERNLKKFFCGLLLGNVLRPDANTLDHKHIHSLGKQFLFVSKRPIIQKKSFYVQPHPQDIFTQHTAALLGENIATWWGETARICKF